MRNPVLEAMEKEAKKKKKKRYTRGRVNQALEEEFGKFQNIDPDFEGEKREWWHPDVPDDPETKRWKGQ